MSVSDIVNMAQAGWKIIEDGKPSAQISGSTCNAVPHVDDWQSLSAPQGTNRLSWRLQYTNGFDIDVVSSDSSSSGSTRLATTTVARSSATAGCTCRSAM